MTTTDYSLDKQTESSEMEGLVIYTDGGALKNPGPAGSGLHGYRFNFVHPTQGTGNTKHVLTQLGYYTVPEYASRIGLSESNRKDVMNAAPKIPESVSLEWVQEQETERTPYEVSVLEYVDGFIAYGLPRTNNYGELNGVLKALALVKEYLEEGADLRYVKVISDSQYVIKGVTEYLDKWALKDFTKSDGERVANDELWKLLHTAKKELTERGVFLTFEWIKGHNDFLGNENADRLATTAVNIATTTKLSVGEDLVSLNRTPAKGYWKNDVEKPDLLFSRYVVFNCGEDLADDVFFTCRTKDGLDRLGSNQRDIGFAYVHLKNPKDSECVTMLSQVMRKQASALEHTPVMAVVDTDLLFKKVVVDTYRISGLDGFVQGNDFRKELFTPSREAERENLTHVLNPPFLSFRTEQVRELLGEIYDSYINGTEGLIVNDITDVFYETVEKKVAGGKTKPVKILRAEKKPGHARERISVEYATQIPETPRGKADVILTLAQDMPDRNTLKRIEEKDPTIKVLTWPQAPHIFSYAVLVECEDGWSLSCGYFSNTRYLLHTEINTGV